MQLGQDPEPFTQSRLCLVTNLSSRICLPFGMLQQSRPCTTSGHCSGRHGRGPSCFQRPPPLSPGTLTTLKSTDHIVQLKSAEATHILFYKSLRQLNIMQNVKRSCYYPLEHSPGQKKKKKSTRCLLERKGGKVKKDNVKEIQRPHCILHSVYLTRLSTAWIIQNGINNELGYRCANRDLTRELPDRECEFPFDRNGLSVTVLRCTTLLNIRKEIKQNE